MPEVQDGYQAYYADRIWNLIPGVYRARDSDRFGENGPLRELVDRIAVQVAVVRRSVDRLWADQSIETSDDWVVPYIADLLDTRLVGGLDARGRRLDVAKTIHYRRRKGTVAVLEEIARDLTGWAAHVVEAFRRLSRTRHGLDPPVGPGPFAAALPTPCPRPGVPPGAPDVHELLEHEGLVGPLTGTPAGGYADLRSVHGARLADAPFDELFHTADVRKGHGATGWYGIPKLLVFLWRLQSFTVDGATPVELGACPGTFVFDPTGRNVPLFQLPIQPELDADTWTSAPEWDVPGPLTQSLLDALDDPGADPPQHAPYPGRDDVPGFFAASSGSPLEPLAIEAWPEAGQFDPTAAFDAATLRVTYQYGFPSAIGAGPYDRSRVADPPARLDPEEQVGGGAGLDTALHDAAGAGTVTIRDSLTYTAVEDVAAVASLLVRGGPYQRPVVRLPAGDTWTFTGAPGADLTLDGLFVSGGDLVLQGPFARVRLTGCTADPGTLDDTGAALAQSVDGRALAPVTIWIEGPGAIEQLVVDHCVLGPVRTRNGGAVLAASISDSTVQGIAPAGAALAVFDPELLQRAVAADNPLSQAILARLADASPGGIAASLAAVVAGPGIWDEALFVGVPLPAPVQALVAQGAAADTAALNLGLLRAAFPVALAPAALALADGRVDLARVSVLGDAYLHRLDASDSILAGFTAAEDAQDGCVRFSAVGAASRVASPYLSVSLTAGAAIFTSTSFGDPAYAQLLETVDGAIAAGADNGSEMGAYCAELGPVKERGLLLKYAEYMPLGLTPVVVHVT